MTGEYEQEGSKQDWDYAADCVGHFLGGSPAAEAEEWRDLQLRLVDELTVEQVSSTFAATVEATRPLMIVAGPEAAADAIPDADEVLALAGTAVPTSLEPRPAEAAGIEALMEAPDPAAVAQASALAETVVPVFEYENGLRFVYLPTEIHEGHVELLASSPGGWATLDPADVAEAQLIGDLMAYSGVAGYDQVSLERYLAGTEVSLEPYVEEVWEGFRGLAATEDIETLFQLAHLYMAEPRFDPVAITIVQRLLGQAVEHPETLADVALEKEVADARFGGDPRFAPFPSAEELAALDLDRAEAVFADRFADPGDFVFVLVGDFVPETAEDLAARYLGTLPGAGEPEGITNVRPAAPAGVVTRTVEAGTGERGAVVLQFTTEQALTPAGRVHLDILEAVINTRLMAHIREELSASYSPTVAIDQRDEPSDGVDVSIRVDGDPGNLDAVVAAVLADLTDLTTNGPTEEEFASAQEQV
ncbi:MAG: hypothetical protein H6Q11_1497, partial [Acidobacteria bacterium]|nr:hypothetical protein [Acidobacteriota bacterium]